MFITNIRHNMHIHLKYLLPIIFTFSGIVSHAGDNTFLNEYLKDTAVFSSAPRNLGYPSYYDRPGWKNYFGEYAETFIKDGEKWLDYRYTYIPASVYIQFEKTGDRSSFSADDRARDALKALIFAELAEGKGRFIPAIIDGVWYFAEKISWVHPQHAKRKSTHRSLGDPDEEIIGITSSMTGVEAALAYHFFHNEWDKVDPSISRAVRKSLDEHIIKPFLDESLTDANWWLGMTPGVPVINWCPWINFNSIFVFFLVEDNQEVLSAALRRSFKSMDNYMNYLRPDGGCDEGPSYWAEAAGKVFDYVSLLKKASGGRFDLSAWPRLQKMGKYIADLYVGDNWVVSHADGYGRLFPSDSYASLLYRFGKLLDIKELQDMGLEYFRGVSDGDIFNRLECMPILPEMKASEKPSSVEKNFKDAWYPDNEVAVIRRGEWYMFVLGHNNYAGPRNDTHNHNDVGEFVLFYDNMPVFIDMGKATPTNGTYDKERYTFFHIRSNSHNVPAINGAEQEQGSDRKAENVKCNPGKGIVSMDIARAYGNEAAADSWRRICRLEKTGFTLSEHYRLKARKGEDLFRFMTRGDIESPVPGKLRIKVMDFDMKRSHILEMAYPPELELTVDTLTLTDPTFSKVWGSELKQIVFKGSKDAPVKGEKTFKVRAVSDK